MSTGTANKTISTTYTANTKYYLNTTNWTTMEL